MVIIPKEQPVLHNLNSYYVDIMRLFEHCQGEWGSGGIYFKSQQRQALIYFDSSELLNGIYERFDTTMVGQPAREAVLADVGEFNFTLQVYRIDPEVVYFWANLPHAEPVYTNLSTEFTNLAALIRKLRSENLTGAIDVIFGESGQGGLLFFSNGQLVGGSYSWMNGSRQDPQVNLKRLLAYSQKQAAVFNVWKISTTPEEAPPPPENSVFPAPQTSEPETEEMDPFDPLGATEQLLQILEAVVTAQKGPKLEFTTLLKRKFMSKVNRYAFLDPFAGELEYSGHRLRVVGDSDPAEIAQGVTEVVCELAGELQLNPRLAQELRPWMRRYESEIKQLGLKI